MKKLGINYQILVVTVLFSLFQNTSSLYGQGSSISFETGTWEEVLKKAESENKPIFVDAYATWCGPCKMMAQNVFTDNSVALFYNDMFINVKMDMEKGEGVELAKQWKIRAYPTLLYFFPNGELMHQSVGGRDVTEFIALGQDALNLEKQLGAFVKKYKDGNRESEFLADYATRLTDAYMDANGVLTEYFQTQKEADLSNEQNMNIIYLLVEDVDSREFKYLEKNWKLFGDKFGNNLVKYKITDVYSRMLYNSLMTANDKEYATAKKQILAKKNDFAKEAVMSMDMNYFLLKEDWKNYAKTAEKYVNQYAGSNHDVLNNIAWLFYEETSDKKQLNKALSWAKKSVELNENPYNLDTYAHLLNALGNKEEAVKQLNRALELAIETNDPIMKDLEENLKKIER